MPLQDHRRAAFKSKLGDDTLVLRGFSGEEHLSRPFAYTVELGSDDPAVDFAAVVGKEAVIRFELGVKGTRYIHGYISRFTQVGGGVGEVRYQAEMVPWLWFLTRTSDCRIFQEMTVPDIVEKVFKDFGFTDYKLNTSRTYVKLENCVQYRETSFDFVNRLLEQEGITYFFDHTDSKHTMVLSDSPSGHATYPGYEEIEWHPFHEGDAAGDSIHDWTVVKQFQPASYTHRDFDFTKSRTELESTASYPGKVAGDEMQVYDYPGAFQVSADGDAYASVRAEEMGANQDIVQGSGEASGIAVGHRFTLKSHPRKDQNIEYLVVALSHRYDQSAYQSGEVSSGPPYTCSFTVIPASRQYRPRRATPKPFVKGPQTAFVVGKAGEEIWVDKFGRIKVKFHWDRYAKGDETSSCWIRVSSEWAGKKWGAIYLPRIGQEVIVDFLEGDPDRPIVTGRVYNDVTMPPYPLPDQKTKSTLKSNSSKGGAGFNEIRFEDKKGDEQIFIHGEKNVDIRIKNDTFEWIGHDRHLHLENDQFENVGNDRHEKIKRDHIEEIGRDHHLAVKGKEAIEVTGSHSFKVSDDVIEEFAKNQSTQVTKNLYIKAENIVIEASTNITINVGESFIAIESGGIKISTNGDIVMEAKQNISAKATMDIKAEATMNAALKGTVGLKLEGTTQAELKGAMTNVKGDGMLVLKGGVVMIN